MNTIGSELRLTLFGASHGTCVGAVLDGVPPGMIIDLGRLQNEVDLRKPSMGIGTPRAEEDRIEVLSGILNGQSTGGPITLVVMNRNIDSAKYEKFKTVPRPGHADLTARGKYSECADLRGGGQFSGRMTVGIVAAGAIAKMLLEERGVRVAAYLRQVGPVKDEEERSVTEAVLSRSNEVRAAAPEMTEMMRAEILKAGKDGDSVGGVVQCIIDGLPMGLGEPFFDTVEGEISKMMFAVPGVKGIEFGAGFAAAGMRGSQHNDPFILVDGKVRTAKNDAGGILGGITNGMPLVFRVAIKPTASIARGQRSLDVKSGQQTELKIEGRHDPCIAPRAVAVVEAGAALVLADLSVRGGTVD
ncbi:MAG: chorismate synthase [Methanomassiliicoccales archaeon]|nr:chorismate synthase [Methanomassiliicoccales archaeon]